MAGCGGIRVAPTYLVLLKYYIIEVMQQDLNTSHGYFNWYIKRKYTASMGGPTS